VTLRETAVQVVEEQLRARELNHIRLAGQLEQQRIALQAFERQLSERTTRLDAREAGLDLRIFAALDEGKGAGKGKGGSGKGKDKGEGTPPPVAPGLVASGRRVRHRGTGSGGGGGSGSGEQVFVKTLTGKTITRM